MFQPGDKVMTQTDQRISSFPQSIKHVIKMAIEHKKSSSVFPKTTRAAGVPSRVRTPSPPKPKVNGEFEALLGKIAIIETGINLDCHPDHIMLRRKNGQVLKLTVELINKP